MRRNEQDVPFRLFLDNSPVSLRFVVPRLRGFDSTRHAVFRLKAVLRTGSPAK